MKIIKKAWKLSVPKEENGQKTNACSNDVPWVCIMVFAWNGDTQPQQCVE